MTFNIGSQTGGVINNVGRDQHITGGQQGIVTTEAARQAVRDLMAGLSASALDEKTAQQARSHTDEIDAELGKVSRTVLVSRTHWNGSPACSPPPGRS
jgi:hypothetical protein